ETMAVPGGLETNSTVNAPTIITLNPAATAAPSVERSTPVPTNGEAFRQQPVFDHAGSMSAQTIAESGDAGSILTVPQDRSRQRDIPMAVAAPQAQVAVPASRGKSALLIGAVVVVVILAVAGIGGFLIYNYNWSKANPNTVGAGTNANSSSVATAPAPREISRYWLELEKPSANVAGLVPIASGQSLKLHFVFSEDGYV